jgi:hypothetical protein
MNFLMMIALAMFASSSACAYELIGTQNVECDGNFFLITSIDYSAAMELKDTKNQVQDVRSYGLGQGGANEWACVLFDKYYLIFRGYTMVRLSDTEAVELNVHDVFDTVEERFTVDGKIGKYMDFLEERKTKLAKKLYPKLDSIYHKAKFKKFDFE